MDTKHSNSKRRLALVSIILLIIFTPIILYLAAILGFGISFGSCFGEPSCSEGSQLAIFTIPLIAIAAIIYAIYKLSKISGHEKEKQLEARIRERENLPKNTLDTNALVINALEQYGPLTSEDIALKLKLPEETIYTSVKELLQASRVRQELDGSTVKVVLN